MSEVGLVEHGQQALYGSLCVTGAGLDVFPQDAPSVIRGPQEDVLVRTIHCCYTNSQNRVPGGCSPLLVDRGINRQRGYRAVFPPIPTRSNASLLSLSFLKTIPPRTRFTPFVPLCPEVPDLLEMQDRRSAFSEDCRALTLLGGQYHRSHYC